MIRSRLLVQWLAALLAISLAVCGGGQTRGHPLDRSWSDEDGHELEEFVSTWKPPRSRNVPAVVVGVVDEKTLVGRSLDQATSWRFEHELESRPVIAGTVVVGIGGGYLFALDVRSGDQLWQRKALGKLRGADDDGSTTIVSIASLSGEHSVVLAIARDGSVTRQIYEKAVIGRPAVLSSFAFLPYNDKWVLIFDLIEGHEVARIVSDRPFSHAFLVDGTLLFAENDVVRFDSNIVAARYGGGSRLVLPSRALPNKPRWLGSGAVTVPVAAGRDDLVRLHVRPVIQGRSGPLRLDNYLLTYHRLAVGLDGKDGSTRWVHTSDELLLGADATSDRFLLCRRDGKISWLAASDATWRSGQSLGERLVACVVQAGQSGSRQGGSRQGGLRQSGSRQDGSPSDGTLAPPPLSAQLLKAISARGAGMLAMQLELLEDLARLSDDRATDALVKLASRVSGRREPWQETEREARTALANHAAALLARRRSGAGRLRQLLRQAVAATAPVVGHRGLPVGAMARALVAMSGSAASARASLMALAPFLLAPSLPDGEQAEVATAVALLVDPSGRALRPARIALTSFLARHACAADDRRVRRALPVVVDRLIQLGGSAVVRQALRTQTKDGCEDPAMTRRLHAALEAAGLSVYGSRPR